MNLDEWAPGAAAKVLPQAEPPRAACRRVQPFGVALRRSQSVGGDHELGRERIPSVEVELDAVGPSLQPLHRRARAQRDAELAGAPHQCVTQRRPADPEARTARRGKARLGE